jgi:hypothetical protein
MIKWLVVYYYDALTPSYPYFEFRIPNFEFRIPNSGIRNPEFIFRIFSPFSPNEYKKLLYWM